MREATEKKVILDDVDPAVFDVVVAWLYRGDRGANEKRGYKNVYNLADRFCIEGLLNDITDELQEQFETVQVTVHLFRKVMAGCAPGTKMVDFWTQLLAYEMVLNGYQNLDEFVKIDPALLIKVLAALDAGHKLKAAGRLQDPKKMRNCDFHVHQDSEPCDWEERK